MRQKMGIIAYMNELQATLKTETAKNDLTTK